MDLNSIVSARIHPAIGVARVGNSRDYFIGPEVPYPGGPLADGYRDAQGKLKRQAARFRIYGYDAGGNVIGELTSSDADIAWTVHVANKKAAWYDFDAALDLPEAVNLKSPRRNAGVQGKDRAHLVIDPGSRTVSGGNHKPAVFDTGKFFGTPIYLGEILTDADGRLIFAGGLGHSASPIGYTLTTFANNAGWHDDTSDGPVSAAVKIAGKAIPVESAWVVTTPPNYAPDMVTPQTMYDVIFDTLNGSMISAPAKPSFTNDILPLLRQCVDAQWVNSGFLAIFGWKSPNDFLREDYLFMLSTPPAAGPDGTVADPFQEMRRQVVYSFRDPSATEFEPLKWPPLYGDAFGSYDSPPGPRVGFAVTKTIYSNLTQWLNGDFIADYSPSAAAHLALEQIAVEQQPATLDKAALHFCMGGPFHPGCEMTWPMRISQMYRAPFRLQPRHDGAQDPDYGEYLTQATVLSTTGPLSTSGPGDISKWMAVPWQSDTDSCRSGYPDTEFPADSLIPSFWPSRVPNQVLTEEDYASVIDANKTPEQRLAAFHTRPFWLRNLMYNAPYLEQLKAMVEHFGDLGIVERREANVGPEFPAVMYVETLPPLAAAPFMMAMKQATAEVSASTAPLREMAHARFRHRQR